MKDLQIAALIRPVKAGDREERDRPVGLAAPELPLVLLDLLPIPHDAHEALRWVDGDKHEPAVDAQEGGRRDEEGLIRDRVENDVEWRRGGGLQMGGELRAQGNR